METIKNWGDILYTSFEEMLIKISLYVPNIIGALLILVLGWIVTKILIFLLKKALKLIRFDQLTSVINDLEIFESTKLRFSATKILITFFKFGMFLLVLLAAFEILNWQSVSDEITELLRYLPKLLSAIALFLVGIYVARFIKTAIEGLLSTFDVAGAKTLGSIVFYLIAILVTITSLNQAGIDTTVITNNVTLILGGFVLAVVIGFGFGSRNIVESLLFSFYSKRNFRIGQKVKFDDVEGEILDIDNICVSIKTAEDIVVMPIKEFAEQRVKIRKN